MNAAVKLNYILPMNFIWKLTVILIKIGWIGINNINQYFRQSYIDSTTLVQTPCFNSASSIWHITECVTGCDISFYRYNRLCLLSLDIYRSFNIVVAYLSAGSCYFMHYKTSSICKNDKSAFDFVYGDSDFNGVFYRYAIEGEKAYYKSKNGYFISWSQELFSWRVTFKAKGSNNYNNY